MLIAGVLCLGAAIACAGFGAWALTRPRPADPAQLALRAVAPAQLAAAFMLAAGGTVALVGPPGGLVVVAVCVAGAVGTLAAGLWQGARYSARRPAPPVDSGCSGCCCAESSEPCC